MINLALIKLCSVSEIEPGNMKMFEYKNTKGLFSIEKRSNYARIFFDLTMRYDSLINTYFSQNINSDKKKLMADNLLINIQKQDDLRYGENPHQSSSYYSTCNCKIIWKQLQGKK